MTKDNLLSANALISYLGIHLRQRCIEFLKVIPRLRNVGVLLVYHSTDNDGTASCAVAEYALRLMRLPYRCKGVKELTDATLEEIVHSPEGCVVFLDIGSSNLDQIKRHLGNANKQVFILDHHNVRAVPCLPDNIYDCNPVKWGIDIHKEAVGASITYLFFKEQMPNDVLKDEFRWASQFVAAAVDSDRQHFSFDFKTIEKALNLSRENLLLCMRSGPHYLMGKLVKLIRHAVFGLNYEVITAGIDAGIIEPRVGPDFPAPTKTSLVGKKISEDQLHVNLAKTRLFNGSYSKKKRDARSFICKHLCGSPGGWKKGCLNLRKKQCPAMKSYYDLKYDLQARLLVGFFKLRKKDPRAMFGLLKPHFLFTKHPIFEGKEAGVVAHLCTALIRQGMDLEARQAYLGVLDKNVIDTFHKEYNKMLWHVLSCISAGA